MNNKQKIDEKKPYEVLKPIAIDGRREIGEIINLTKTQASAIGKEYIQEAEAEQEEESSPARLAGKPKKRSTKKMSLAKLREYADELGIQYSNKATKGDLQKAIKLYFG